MNMILRYFYLFNSILFVRSWGSIGHGLVARLAQTQLTNVANIWINQFIPNELHGDLSRIASWPDSILYADTNPFDSQFWQWSRPLHFIDTPDWNCSYIPSRDCPDNICVHGAIQNYSQRLISENCDYVEQQRALFFLVHFVGDVHQPLHTGFRGDFGGNAVKGFFFDKQNLTNLHAIWDEKIIEHRIEHHFQSDLNSYFEYLQTLMINYTVFVNEKPKDFIRWIDESLEYVCEDVYLDDDYQKINASKHFFLSENYFHRNWPLIDQRLVRSGFRLGLLLNELSQHRSSIKLSPRIQVLIVTLSITISLSISIVLTLFCLHRRHQTYRTDQRPLFSDESSS